MDLKHEDSLLANIVRPSGEANPAVESTPVGSSGTRLDGPHSVSAEVAAAPRDSFGAAPADSTGPTAAPQNPRRWRKPLVLAIVAVAMAVAAYVVAPRIETALNTVSTDDAYVNSHVT